MAHAPLPLHPGILLARSDRTIARRFHRGELVRLTPGAYLDVAAWAAAPPSERFWARCTALHHTLRPVFCGETALALHGLPTFGPPPEIELAVAGRGHAGRVTVPAVYRGSDPAVRRLVALEPAVIRRRVAVPCAVARPGGMALVPVQESLLDVAARLPLTPSLAPADGLLRIPEPGDPRRGELLEAVKAWIAGARRERALLVLGAASGAAESPGESVSRALMLEGDLERPVLQQEFIDERGLVGYADFFWPSVGVIGEFDGKLKYNGSLPGASRSADAVFGDEKARENRLVRLGYRVVRWGWADLHVPGRVVSTLRAAGVPWAASA